MMQNCVISSYWDQQSSFLDMKLVHAFNLTFSRNKYILKMLKQLITGMAKHQIDSAHERGDRACIHASPHLIVQIQEVPLEVMRENVVLAAAVKKKEEKKARIE